MFCNMYMANNSSILQYCHGMSIEGVLVFYRTTEYANSWKGGGLNCEAKAQVLVVTPPPLFPESRSQKGGVTAGQYGMHAHLLIIVDLCWRLTKQVNMKRCSALARTGMHGTCRAYLLNYAARCSAAVVARCSA